MGGFLNTVLGSILPDLEQQRRAAPGILPALRRSSIPQPILNLEKNPGTLLLRPVSAAAAPAGAAATPAPASAGQPSYMDPRASESGAATPMEGTAAPAALPRLGGSRHVPSLIDASDAGVSVRAVAGDRADLPSYMSAGGTSAAPAMIPRIGPAASRYAQDLEQTGPTAEDRAAAGVPQTTRQKLLRGVEAAGLSLLGGKNALQVAEDFYNAPEARAEQGFASRVARDKAAADFERQGDQDARQASTDDLNRRNVESEIALRGRQAQPDNPADKKLETYTNDLGRETIVFQRPDGSTYEKSFGTVQGKSDRYTSPWEAYAYGTPQERQAAQDFLSFEKRIGAENDKPGEIEQRYQLYRRDPEAYKAMFGDRGSAQDQAQAGRMLNYFDRQRKQIEGDWTLDEATRAQRLAEIDDLERPYLDAATPQPNAGGNAGAAQFKRGDTVYDKQGNQRKVKRVLSDGRLELE